MDRLEITISRYEDRALELNDLSTAMKLNWLRNAVKYDGLDCDDACYQFLSVVIAGKFGVIEGDNYEKN